MKSTSTASTCTQINRLNSLQSNVQANSHGSKFITGRTKGMDHPKDRIDKFLKNSF